MASYIKLSDPFVLLAQGEICYCINWSLEKPFVKGEGGTSHLSAHSAFLRGGGVGNRGFSPPKQEPQGAC